MDDASSEKRLQERNYKVKLEELNTEHEWYLLFQSLTDDYDLTEFKHFEQIYSSPLVALVDNQLLPFSNPEEISLCYAANDGVGEMSVKMVKGIDKDEIPRVILQKNRHRIKTYQQKFMILEKLTAYLTDAKKHPKGVEWLSQLKASANLKNTKLDLKSAKAKILGISETMVQDIETIGGYKEFNLLQEIDEGRISFKAALTEAREAKNEKKEEEKQQIERPVSDEQEEEEHPQLNDQTNEKTTPVRRYTSGGKVPELIDNKGESNKTAKRIRVRKQPAIPSLESITLRFHEFGAIHCQLNKVMPEIYVNNTLRNDLICDRVLAGTKPVYNIHLAGGKPLLSIRLQKIDAIFSQKKIEVESDPTN